MQNDRGQRGEIGTKASIVSTVVFALALFGTHAFAQTTLRPTPDYFAEAVFDMSMAQALARSCNTISVDPISSGARAEALLAQLDDDGFDPTAPHEQMEDPDGAIEVLQLAFVERHDLTAPGEDKVCAVAMAEMTDDSGIGQLLVEVPG